MITSPCDICPTRGEKCVPGRGNPNAEVLGCGEAPGKDEEKSGICWVGKAGKELDNYLSVVSRIDPESIYRTNLLKFHPPNDRDPTQAEIVSCSQVLERELESVRPRVIAALGAYSTKYFLGSGANLERVHGIPVVGKRNGQIIVPIYHPAAGLHNTSTMTQIMHDFEVLGRVVRGQQGPGELEDEYPDGICVYDVPRSSRHLADYLSTSNLVSIDTESVKVLDSEGRWWGKTEPWCLSVSTHPGTALVVFATDKELVRVVGGKLADRNTTTIIHNVMYDLPILEQMGVIPAKYYCTMIMAYLTQSLPQGLKDLAYRLAGMQMDSYEEVVAEASRERAWWYLKRIGGIAWPDTEPELVWESGEPRVRKGWPLHKRVTRILADFANGDKEVDLRGRWHNIEDKLLVQAVERFGLMPIGDLSEVNKERAVRYSARDADATVRIFPDLRREVERMNIERGEVIDGRTSGKARTGDKMQTVRQDILVGG